MKQAFLIVAGWIILSSVAFGQEIYQWTDEKGTVHYTDDLTLVPERYRNQVQEKKAPRESPPQLSPPVLKEEEVVPQPESTAEKKDLAGRGQEWWKAKAKEWNEKLINAQKNYETAYTAWKEKEKEQEQSKLKPKSLQRKLKTETKILEDKARAWEKQRDEAKNMLEKGLRKEAEEMNADPDWVRIE
ncbi:MAG: DUF4124 domain-containing protein [Thermodesulfobacteriota bacterium]